jgi:hypothetical protein
METDEDIRVDQHVYDDVPFHVLDPIDFIEFGLAKFLVVN